MTSVFNCKNEINISLIVEVLYIILSLLLLQ